MDNLTDTLDGAAGMISNATPSDMARDDMAPTATQEGQTEEAGPEQAPTEEAARPTPRRVTREELLAYRAPVIEPLSEEFTLPGFAAPVQIVGVTAFAKQRNIFAEIDRLTRIAASGKNVITNRQTGAQYKLTETDIVAAAWAAACVTPTMTAVEWLQAGAEQDLMPLYARCLVCSRRIEEVQEEEAEPEEVQKEEAKAQQQSPRISM